MPAPADTPPARDHPPLTLRRRLALAYPFSVRLVVGLYGLYGAVAFAVYFASKRSGVDISLCAFKNFTGHPCATCGGTRAAVRLLHLDLPGAIEYNPFATALILFVVGWAIVSFVRAGRPLIRWTSRRRIIAASLALAALIVNWVYVWEAEPRLTARDHAAHGAPAPR